MTEKILLNTNYVPLNKRGAISDAEASSVSKLVRLRGVKDPTYSYFGEPRTWEGRYDDYYKNHEYELYEYSRIIDTEAIVAKAFERKRALIFKNGFYFRSNDDKNIKYIKNRIKQIEYVSGKTFRSFLEEMVYNLIMFHNAYIVLVRNKDKSTGKEHERNGKEYEPIAAWFNMPTESVQRKIAPNGTVTKYRQYIGPDRYIVFKADKVRHLTYNKRTGFVMGTPPLEAVKDDILALRRIEESVERLIYKSLFPLIHVKVGTEARPATVLRDGRDEVVVMTNVIERLEEFGGVTTNERVEIKTMGAESLALRVESYLEYFKRRVILGLGVSDVDMGTGDSSGRSTGAIISQVLKDAVINMQEAITDFVTTQLFNPLLVESGRYKAEYLIPEEEVVHLAFNFVDQDSQIQMESHILNLFNSGLLSVNEARKEMGYREMSEEEIKKIGQDRENFMPPTEVEVQKASAEASIISAKASAANKSAPSGKKPNSSGNRTKAEGAKKSAASKVKPKNQFSDSESMANTIRALEDDNKIIDYITSSIMPVLDSYDVMTHNSIETLIQNRLSVFKDSTCTNAEIDQCVSDLIYEIGQLL